jgi:transcriptional regulator with XRE-family HTH domain
MTSKHTGRSMNPLSLSEGIRYLRKRKGMSARRVSLEAGLSSSYVSKVEKGEIEPSISSFYKICQVIEATDKEVVFLLKLVSRD